MPLRQWDIHCYRTSFDRRTWVKAGDNDPVPTGFYGDENIDSISVTVFLNELGTYRATFAQKHSSLPIGTTDDVDQMIVQNILNSWKAARLAINKKHSERGDKKLPVEQQLYDIRALMAETPIEQMTPEQLIDTIKSTFVTSAHITSLEMSFFKPSTRQRLLRRICRKLERANYNTPGG